MARGRIRDVRRWLAQTVALCAVLAAAAVPCAPALAGALTIMPVKVEIAPDKQFCSLTVGNDAPEAVTVQLRGYRWRQTADGADQLDPAPQLVVNPAIVTIAPGERRLVRCSVPLEAGVAEATYRILVNELPAANSPAGGLQTLLQISIPVFRAEPQARPQITWSQRDDGCVALTNTGTAHARLASVQVHTDGF
ncbi:MAG: fimbria/pilus periplasmic chaperone [Porphyrobacter sp.]|jgi:fimbrial chaperone protein|nr:fimbria/pilus periplasmic chaperone [Porphyrobacter sp.]